MKRYLLFAGSRYYPRGGMDDFQFNSDSIEECKLEFSKSAEKEDFNWAHIFDLESESIIFHCQDERGDQIFFWREG